MKILHINSDYTFGKFYKNLYDNQMISGIDIDVFVPVSFTINPNDFDYGSYTAFSKNHNKYDRFLFHKKNNKIYRNIQQKYCIEDYSIIHAHFLFSNGYTAMKLKQKYGIPYIVAVRNTDLNFFFKRMVYLRKLGVEILSEAKQVVFLSKSYRDQTIKKYVPEHLKDKIYNKSMIIPNGIDDYWFNNMGESKKRQTNDIRLEQVGDINKNKNIETTVKAVEILNKKGYKVKLDVVGAIKEKRVFNRIKNIKCVNYLGYKTKEELINIYRKNDIYVMPSIHETFGLVYAEAMSQGLPVIYTKEQGFDGHFKDGEVGYAVNCFNPIDIANNIIKINNNYSQISKNCIRNTDMFSWKRISDSYEMLYKDILRIE